MKVQIINKVELTKVYIDGHDVSKRLSKVNVKLDEESCPVIKIELLPDEIEIEGDFEVLKKIPQEKCEGHGTELIINGTTVDKNVISEELAKAIIRNFNKNSFR